VKHSSSRNNSSRLRFWSASQSILTRKNCPSGEGTLWIRHFWTHYSYTLDFLSSRCVSLLSFCCASTWISCNLKQHFLDTYHSAALQECLNPLLHDLWAALRNKSQAWDVATFGLGWERVHSHCYEGAFCRRGRLHFFISYGGGGWVGGLSWLRGSEGKESWTIVLEGSFCFPCLFFLLCLTVISLILLANELNFVKYETE
jgi:hypothetical protein